MTKPVNLPKVRTIWIWNEGEESEIRLKVTAVREEDGEWLILSRLLDGSDPEWVSLDEWLAFAIREEPLEIPL